MEIKKPSSVAAANAREENNGWNSIGSCKARRSNISNLYSPRNTINFWRSKTRIRSVPKNYLSTATTITWSTNHTITRVAIIRRLEATNNTISKR